MVFDWRLSRRYGERMSLIDGYRGVLQSDCFEAYANFTHTHDGVVWVGCWAHARRNFFEALGEKSKAVHRVLRLIDRLYRFEANGKAPASEPNGPCCVGSILPASYAGCAASP